MPEYLCTYVLEEVLNFRLQDMKMSYGAIMQLVVPYELPDISFILLEMRTTDAISYFYLVVFIYPSDRHVNIGNWSLIARIPFEYKQLTLHTELCTSIPILLLSLIPRSLE